VGAPPAPSRKTICIVHDIEEDVDTEVDPAACRAALGRMLAIEREHGVPATYSVLGRLFRDKAAVIRAQGDHALAFHSFDHRLDDLSQLARVREVDLQIKGYRPPRSQLTGELTDYALVYRNFEWVMCSELVFEFQQPKVENGLVKVPVYMDDWMLHTGELTRARWEPRLLYEIDHRDFVAFGLHDCYAEHWLDWYGELLEALKKRGEVVTVEEAVSRAWRAHALAPSLAATFERAT
jgi:peptidoglycan/xylan/chitin deacetylase (PgdA/CDA1 family)